jgi:hypothetical protein
MQGSLKTSFLMLFMVLLGNSHHPLLFIHWLNFFFQFFLVDCIHAMIRVASPKCPLLSFITHLLLEKELSTPSILTMFCCQLIVSYLFSSFPIISLSFFIINSLFLLVSLSSLIVFHFQFHIVIPNCCPLLFLSFISSFPRLIHCSLSMS